MTGQTLARALGAALLVAAVSCGGGDGSGRTPLVVYSPHGTDLLSWYEKEFETANPTIDVQWMDMGSQDVLDRLRSEKANPQADLWFGAPAEVFNRAARDSLLEAYQPTWAAQVSAEAKHPAHLWYGTYLTPEVIAYNKEVLTPETAPRDWDDVIDPKWKDKVIIRDPVASGTMRAIWGAILIRSMNTTGSTAAGWEWLRKLDANTREYALDPSALAQRLGQRVGVVSLFAMPDIAGFAKTHPIAWAIPTSGTPLLVDAIAIVKGGKHPEAARSFYEFVTTPAALQHAAANFGRIPARGDMAADSLPTWIREVQAQIKPMALDAGILADSLDSWMTYWDANVRNCCK